MSAPPKIARTAWGLCDRSFNCFEAAQLLHDWVLRTTVSTIQARGIVVDRWPEDVPGYGGSSVRVMRYRIPESQRSRVERTWPREKYANQN